MKDLSEQTLYEVLELAPGCGAEELAKAYTQAKQRYGPGSLATYALVEPGEAEALLHRIEEAFAVLSDPEQRRAYDTAQAPSVGTAHLSSGRGEEEVSAPEPEPAPRAPEVPPPTEPRPLSEPESTPEPSLSRREEEAESPASAPAPVASPPPAQASPPASPSASPPASPPASPSAPSPASPPASPSASVASSPHTEPPPEPKPVHRTESDLPADAPVTGDALRRVREARGLSLKDVEGRTKIGHWHLENIERERYADLPAQVYLRGFLMSLARELKLDPVRVARSYLEQMKVKHQAKPE